ncbi:MAG: uroporphyrinogen decarboxylase family protein [Methanocellales archaeon]
MKASDFELITTITGSYPTQPEEAKEELISVAIKEAIADQIKAGIRLISDGQIRDQTRLLAENINGIEIVDDKPVVVDEISRPKKPLLHQDYKLAVSYASGKADVKGIIIGPISFAHQCKLEKTAPYKSNEDIELFYDLAEVLAFEAIALKKAGAEVIQINESILAAIPYLKTARDVINSIAEHIPVPALHVCGSLRGVIEEILEIDVSVLDIECTKYKNLVLLDRDMVEPYDVRIAFGCIDTSLNEVESIEVIQERIMQAIERLGEENIWIKPDCGMRNLPREIAFEKLKNMVEATRKIEKKLFKIR